MEKEKTPEKLQAKEEQRTLMRKLQKALPNIQTGKIHDIKMCHRSSIGILKIYENGKITGLRTCKSGWSCLYCTPLYLLDRQKELEKLFHWVYSRGYTIIMVTETHKHTKKQKLDYLTARHIKALKDFHNSKIWRKTKSISMISGRDCKFNTQNGWHFHSHELLILDKEKEKILKASEKELTKIWASACEKNGLKASERNGLNFIYEIHSPEYISKFDYQPPAIDKIHNNSFSPFRLIENNINKFLEFVFATIGIQRIAWSKNLRKLTQIEREEKIRAKQNKERKKQAKAITMPPQLVNPDFYDHLDDIKKYVKTQGLDAFEKNIKEYLNLKKSATNTALYQAPIYS